MSIMQANAINLYYELRGEGPPLAMIDDAKAWVTDKRVLHKLEWLTIQTIAGDVFEIVRPPISQETEAQLMEQVRAIIAVEDSDGA